MSRLRRWFGRNRTKTERGQGLVEYALIIVLISIAAITAMETMAGGVTGVFSDITGELSVGGSGSGEEAADEPEVDTTGWVPHWYQGNSYLCPTYDDMNVHGVGECVLQ